MCKKIRKNTCFLLVALLCVAPLQARVSTYVGAYGQIGEWSLLPSGSDYSPSFGVAGGLGGVVELQIAPKYSPTAFLLDVGVGACGGMTSFSDVCRVSARSANDEYQRLNYVGFRLVREVTE